MKFVGVILILIITFSCVNNPVKLSKKNNELIELFNKSNSNNLPQTNPDSALVIAQKVVALADSINNDSLKMESQIIIGYILNRKGLHDSAIIELGKTLAMATSLKDSSILTQTYKQLAQSYFDLQKYDTTNYFLNKGLTICKKMNDTTTIAAIYKGLGDIMNKKNQYDSSYYYYQKAIIQYKKINNAVNIAIVYNHISNVFAEQSLTERAAYYLKNSIAINDSLQNNYNLAINYNNLGVLYKNDEQYDSAIIILNKSIALYEKIDDKFGVIIGTYNISNAYSENGNYKKADSALYVVYDYCVANNIKEGIAKALGGMALNEIRDNDFNKAKNHLFRALALFKIQKQTEDEKNILAQIIKLSYMHVDDSMNYFLRYEILSDSIFKNEYLSQIADAETKYSVKLKDESIKILTYESKQSDYQLHILAILITFIIIIVIILFFVIKFKAKNLKKENELLQIKQKNHELILQRTELNLKLKHQQVTSKALLIAENENNFIKLADELYYFKSKLRSIGDRKKLEDLLYNYKNTKLKNPLEEFEVAFKFIYPNFIKNLLLVTPTLTPREVQLCTMIRLNLQSKQIAILTNNSVKSTETIRYRIRKKMNLTPSQNLNGELKKP
ncbi:MAG: tetratricopeptide repeat protein [Bacteroidota bacterium]